MSLHLTHSSSTGISTFLSHQNQNRSATSHNAVIFFPLFLFSCLSIGFCSTEKWNPRLEMPRLRGRHLDLVVWWRPSPGAPGSLYSHKQDISSPLCHGKGTFLTRTNIRYTFFFFLSGKENNSLLSDMNFDTRFTLAHFSDYKLKIRIQLRWVKFWHCILGLPYFFFSNKTRI